MSGEEVTSETANSGAKTVLIVEDNELNMKLFHDLLEAHGYNIIATKDGMEALRIARDKRPDLILMDINMPVMDGVTAFKELRNQTQGDHPPVIALTANALPEQLDAYLSKGMAGCVTKPIQEVELVRTILNVLGRSDSIGIVEPSKSRTYPTLNARQKSAVASLLATMDED